MEIQMMDTRFKQQITNAIQKKKFIRRQKFLQVFLFEFFGTFIFGYINLCSTNAIYANPYLSGISSYVTISLTLFIQICIIRVYTGAYFNPSVTIAFMTRKMKRIDWKLGLWYIFSQVAGGMGGAFLAKYILPNIHSAPLAGTEFPAIRQLYLFGNQILGTFILIFSVLINSQPLTGLVQGDLQSFIYVPLIILIARQYSFKNNGLNPALGLAFPIVYALDNNNTTGLKHLWIPTLGPVVGSLLAVTAFELFYKKFYYHMKLRAQQKNNPQIRNHLISLEILG